MLQSLYNVLSGQYQVLRDGRVVANGQPESKSLLRRYEHAQALREIKRESRIREVLDSESQGFVERIRIRLGIA